MFCLHQVFTNLLFKKTFKMRCHLQELYIKKCQVDSKPKFQGDVNSVQMFTKKIAPNTVITQSERNNPSQLVEKQIGQQGLHRHLVRFNSLRTIRQFPNVRTTFERIDLRLPITNYAKMTRRQLLLFSISPLLT